MGETEGCIASPRETNSELGDFPSTYPSSNSIKNESFSDSDILVPRNRSQNSQTKETSI